VRPRVILSVLALPLGESRSSDLHRPNEWNRLTIGNIKRR